jgi:hypothetical protein
MANELSIPIFLQIGRKRFQVDTFKQASERFCIARDKSGNGASRTPSPLIVDEHGSVIGYVSYNGRVWPGTPQNWQPGATPLYDNTAA